ncbi:MAG: chorismate-binding protein, partial [Candidatus Acidiferrales bacterium]
MIQPDYKSFTRLARTGNLVPVYDCFTADLLTPVGAYLRIARGAGYSFLLESVEGGENIARYTFVGADPAEVFRSRDRKCAVESASGREEFDENPIEVLRRLMARYRPVRVPGLPPLTGGAIGYFAYDMVRLIERIPSTGSDELKLDDAVLMFYRGLVAFDHVRHRVWIVQNVFTEGAGSLRAKYDAAVAEIERTRRKLQAPLRAERVKRGARRGRLLVRSNFTRARYISAVKRAKAYIRAGDIFQVVPSQRFTAKTDADPFEIYRALRVINPSPYMYFLRLDDVA